MPLLESSFNPPWYLRNKHLQTILPALFRTVPGVQFTRERIYGIDNDFLDLDWIHHTSNKVALLVHGLEASTNSAYIRGMARALHKDGWNVAALNLRGVTHQHHELKRTYHSGATDDIQMVVHHIFTNYTFSEMALVGFSLGGNLVIKYAGERGNEIDIRIKKAVAVSVPCDLKSTAYHLDSPARSIYGKRFLRSLKKKLYGIRGRLPFSLTGDDIQNITTLVQYDDHFTAPMYGFRNAEDYYEKCSSKQFISQVKIPMLILTAKDDPFFTTASIPVDECMALQHVWLETPQHGGHVGFMMNHPWGKYYSEQRTIDFLNGQNTAKG
ncbi:MAG: alpha/beta fold hydrolase [Bacteroidetes bacterium]|nr:alpha/beta fold hydrolase [Bacteroidota bacterium]